jgi:hypothetical protein
VKVQLFIILHLLISFNTIHAASQHVKEKCRASEKGQICRADPPPPDHSWCQGSAGHDTDWIFEIRPCNQNRAPGSKALPPTKAKQNVHGPTSPKNSVVLISNKPLLWS